MLVNRTVLRQATLPAAPIVLKTQGQLTKREGIQALDAVLALNGVTMVNVGEKFVKAVAEAQGNTAGAPFNTNSAASLPEMGQYVTHILQLKYAKPSELVPVLQGFMKIPERDLADRGVPDLGVAGLRGEREADAGVGEQDRCGDSLGVCAGGDSDQVWEGGGHRRGDQQFEQRGRRGERGRGTTSRSPTGSRMGGMNRTGTGTTGGFPGMTTPGMVTPPGSAGRRA